MGEGVHQVILGAGTEERARLLVWDLRPDQVDGVVDLLWDHLGRPSRTCTTEDVDALDRVEMQRDEL